jgi:hypothetical protein
MVKRASWKSNNVIFRDGGSNILATTASMWSREYTLGVRSSSIRSGNILPLLYLRIKYVLLLRYAPQHRHLQTKLATPRLNDFFRSQLVCGLFAWLINHQPTVLFSQNKPATSNQPAVLFSQNKPAPAISPQSNEQAVDCPCSLQWWRSWAAERTFNARTYGLVWQVGCLVQQISPLIHCSFHHIFTIFPKTLKLQLSIIHPLFHSHYIALTNQSCMWVHVTRLPVHLCN